MKNLIHFFIVSRSKEFKENISFLLERQGYNYFFLRNIKEFLSLKKELFKIVLLDMEFKDKTDLQSIRDMKKSFPDVEFIIFSHSLSGKVLSELINLGAGGYLEKDFIRDEFFIIVERIIKKIQKYKYKTPKNKTEEKAKQDELELIVKGMRAVLEQESFEITARKIFDYCKELTGANSGYVALLDEEGAENEVLFLDAGGLPCTVDPDLPMPIRGLRAEAYYRKEAVYHNDFNNSEWTDYLPEGHVVMENVMFAPLMIEDEAVGLIGLANKPEGFTKYDARISSLFGELASIALKNSRLADVLRQEKNRTRSYLDIAEIIIVVINADGNIKLINKKGCEILGYDEEEILDKNWFFTSIPEVNRKDVEEYFQKIICGTVKMPSSREAHIINKDGEKRLIVWHNDVLRDEKGEITATVSAGHDITEFKKISDKLKEQYDFLQVLMDAIPAPVFYKDKEGVYLGCNKAFEEYIGISREAIVGKTVYDIAVKELADVYFEKDRLLLEGKREQTYEGQVTYADGTLHDVIFYKSIFTGPDGKCRGLLGVMLDITERKKTEEALRESEEWLRTVIKVIKDGMIVINSRGLISVFNPAAEKLFGRKKEEMIGFSLDLILPEEYREKHGEYVKNYFETGKPDGAIGKTLELSALLSDGTIIPVELSLSSGIIKDEKFVIAIIRDITLRKEAEKEIRKFKTISDRAGYGVGIVNLEGELLYINQAFAEMHGYSAEELEGRDLSIFHNEEQMEKVRFLNEKIKVDGTYTGEEVWHIRKSGTPFPAFMNGVLIKDEEDNPLFMASTAIDITDLKEAENKLRDYSEKLEDMVEERTKELKEAQEKLLRKEKLALIGQLAGTLGHELKNPLGVISNAVYFLKMILVEADDTVTEYLDLISSETGRAGKIISDLRNFSRVKISVEKEKVNISSIISNVLERKGPPENIKINKFIQKNLPFIFADIRHMEQVLLNLIVNAYQAIEGEGEVSIKGEEKYGNIHISVSDTGCGISKEKLDRIFEPLFTTKPRGIGLGLAICKNLIEANSGLLKVESEEGRGSTFSIILPIGKEIL